jgi:hypothetical protein
MSGSLKKIDDQYLEFLQTKKHKIDSVGLDIPMDLDLSQFTEAIST